MEQRGFSSGSFDSSNPYPTPGQYPGPQPVTTAPGAVKRRRHPVLSHAAVAVVALGIGAGIGSSGQGAGASSTQGMGTAATSQAAVPATTAGASTSAASVTTSAAPAKTTAAAAPASSASSVATSVPGDGEYLVGTDMQPGTYRTAGPAADSIGECYWERDKNASGEFDSIIANDSLSGSGVVTVGQGEYFKSTGCQDWVRVG